MTNKIKFALQALSLGAPLLLSPFLAAQGTMHMSSGVRVENPPAKVASKKPSQQDFNALFRDFLGTNLVDVTKETIDPKLTELFSKETSNALYGRLKSKEKHYQGAILVSPVAIGEEQIVVVAARIVYKHFFIKTMQSEYLQVVFSKSGKFVQIRKGVATSQDL